MAEGQKAQREQEENDRIQTVNSIKEFIAKNDTIKGVLPIKDKATKKEFEDYLLKPTVKLKNGQMVTKNVADAIAEQGNTEVILYNAYNRFKKYNTEAIEKVGATKATKSLAEKLEESSKNFKKRNLDENSEPVSTEKDESMSSWQKAFSLSHRI